MPPTVAEGIGSHEMMGRLARGRMELEETCRMLLSIAEPLQLAKNLCEEHTKWRQEGYPLDSEFSILSAPGSSIESPLSILLLHRSLMPQCLDCSYKRIQALGFPKNQPIGHIDTCVCASSYLITECSYCEAREMAARRMIHIKDCESNVSGHRVLSCKCGTRMPGLFDPVNEEPCLDFPEILRYCAGCEGLVSLPLHALDGSTHLAAPYFAPSVMMEEGMPMGDLLGNLSPCLHHPVETWGTRMALVMKMAQTSNRAECNTELGPVSSMESAAIEETLKRKRRRSSPTSTLRDNHTQQSAETSEPSHKHEAMPPPQWSFTRRRSSTVPSRNFDLARAHLSPMRFRNQPLVSQAMMRSGQGSSGQPISTPPPKTTRPEVGQLLNNGPPLHSPRPTAQLPPHDRATTSPIMMHPQLQALQRGRPATPPRSMSPPAAQSRSKTAAIDHPMCYASPLLPPHTQTSPQMAPSLEHMDSPRNMPSTFPIPKQATLPSNEQMSTWQPPSRRSQMLNRQVPVSQVQDVPPMVPITNQAALPSNEQTSTWQPPSRKHQRLNRQAPVPEIQDQPLTSSLNSAFGSMVAYFKTRFGPAHATRMLETVLPPTDHVDSFRRQLVAQAGIQGGFKLDIEAPTHKPRHVSQQAREMLSSGPTPPAEIDVVESIEESETSPFETVGAVNFGEWVRSQSR